MSERLRKENSAGEGVEGYLTDAEALLEDLQGSNEADSSLFGIRKDSRVVSGVRAFILGCSLGGLPQLLNVLVGDHSGSIFEERIRADLDCVDNCGIYRGIALIFGVVREMLVGRALSGSIPSSPRVVTVRV